MTGITDRTWYVTAADSTWTEHRPVHVVLPRQRNRAHRSEDVQDEILSAGSCDLRLLQWRTVSSAEAFTSADRLSPVSQTRSIHACRSEPVHLLPLRSHNATDSYFQAVHYARRQVCLFEPLPQAAAPSRRHRYLVRRTWSCRAGTVGLIQELLEVRSFTDTKYSIFSHLVT